MPQNSAVSRNSLLTWDGRLFKVAETNTNLYFFTKSSMVLHLITSQSLYPPPPPLVQETTTYNLRNSDNVQNYRARFNLFLNSFFPSSIRAWNDLPHDIRNAPSVASFKYKLNRNLNAPPKFYNAGSRKGQILHTRLRLECSSLNSDLFRKHIFPIPSCQCGGFESATYFFFTYPIFTNARQRYLPDNLENFTGNFYLEKKTQQSKITNHSSCKFKILLSSQADSFKFT